MKPRHLKPRVLLAVSPRAAPRMGRILHGLPLQQPSSLRELEEGLRGSSFDLVVIGSHFDGSRAIDALKTSRALAPEVPLVCVRATPFYSALGRATLTAFQTAAEELGADSFIDVLQFPDDAAGNARVRRTLERFCWVT